MARRRSRRHLRTPRLTQPLDRLATAVMTGLAVVLGLLILSGDHATARVRDFTWQDRLVGAEDRAFLITFSRPMDVASVEQNLKLEPPLPGKVSWAGRRMAYTLIDPPPYGESFTLSLEDASDRYAALTAEPSRFEPFQSQFETRRRAFLYIGAEGDEANRLVLADLMRQERTILTPKNLSVIAFKPYSLGDKVLFSASDANQERGLLDQQIYTVTTGITPRPPVDFMSDRPPIWQRLLPQPASRPSGEVDLVLDNRDYQNLKFDLSPDGQAIVVQRVSQQNPADFGPWLVRPGHPAEPIETEPGGDFMIAPDSQSLLLLQGQGTAIIDLGGEPSSGPRQPLDFLPNYGRVLDLAADGTAAAMVNFNQDDPEKRFTESLFLVTNQGREEELLQVSGSILEAHFDPSRPVLYVLATELVEADDNQVLNPDILQAADTYVEQPLLLAVTLEGVVSPLLRLPQQQRIHMSVAPDGRSLLLDLASASTAEGSKIWYLPLVNQPIDEADSDGDIAALGDLEPAAPIDSSDAAAPPATMPAVVDPEVFPFGGVQALWMP
ncbi:MAG: hypothetical protein EA368_00705 [Leptolyngbya sp. DLM2.Bin27]|nr:MAG: hypothetical protein EA368_00705 [Leptolyngbya sp. DLM2.Bin27]